MARTGLRQQVLWIVREQGPLGVTDVCAALREEREISMNAVQTVLTRLVEEGLLLRNGTRRHYQYEAAPSADVVRERAAKAALDLLSQSGEMGLAHFVDTIDKLQPEAIAKLEALLSARRARRGGDTHEE